MKRAQSDTLLRRLEVDNLSLLGEMNFASECFRVRRMCERGAHTRFKWPVAASEASATEPKIQL